MPRQIGHLKGLLRHFTGMGITPGHHCVLVGTKPMDERWMMSITKIEGCADDVEAAWLGQCIQSDLVEYISTANDEVTPIDAVGVETGLINPGPGWTVAVYVILASREEAAAMLDFLTFYATQPAPWLH